MARAIFDTDNNITSKIPQFLAAFPDGLDVIRYITPATSNEKCIKAVEIAAIAATAGKIRLGLVYETFGADEGTAAGLAAGSFSLKYARDVCKAPFNSVIHYTQDRDVPSSHMAGVVLAYTAYHNLVSPLYRVGCYGSGYCCDVLKSKGLIEIRWLTCSIGFTGTRESIAAGRYDLLQKLPRNQYGLDTDPDNLPQAAPGVDLGFFVPGIAPPVSINENSPAADIVWLQVKANLAGKAIAVDGVWGPETATAAGLVV